MSEDPTQRNSDVEETTTQRAHEDSTTPNGEGTSTSEEPDVLLDVSELEVDKISLEVDDLRAHVSVLAELANLVSLSVGADVRLGRVKLEIDGVRAKVLLKVRLEQVRAILEKALDTVAEHPEILTELGRALDELLKGFVGEASATLEHILGGLQEGDTVDALLKGRLEDVLASLQNILERRAVDGAREALSERPATDTESVTSESNADSPS